MRSVLIGLIVVCVVVQSVVSLVIMFRVNADHQEMIEEYLDLQGRMINEYLDLQTRNAQDKKSIEDLWKKVFP